MKSKNMAADLPELGNHIPTCKSCLFGKQKRKSFPKLAKRATCKLQLVHTDIARPQKLLH